ncbi:MAG TPA: CRTAC1 family protein [Thermoanaerobaculia bacterium]|nr:CRTAC1 family protein [Thermoanaerobaculia bacterium]
MSRRRIALLAALAALGWWFYENASLPRLRATFVPWMHRLERYRDALETTRAALRAQSAHPGDAEGIAALRAWAWKDLDRVAMVSFDVDGKPEIERKKTGEKIFLEGEERWELRGTATFVVDGFRADGARVERAARVTLLLPDANAPLPSPLTFKEIPSSSFFSLSFSPLGGDRVETRPRFHDATLAAGLGAPRRDPPQRLTNRLIDGIWPGSGVAVLDFDGDGAEDLFVGDGVRSILYRNDGHGRFTDVTVRAGLAKADGSGVPATGVAAGDVDGDGFPDLAVTDAFGPTRLFRNRGDGTFEEITASSGVVTAGPTRSLAFADVNGDGSLDLFVSGTGDYYGQMPDPPFDANDGRRNYLFLGDGKGHFRDASEAWGVAKPTRWSLSCLFADFDGDGRPDLVVTNDFGLKNLYRNVDGRRFEDVTAKLGAEDRGYGMSAAWGDFDGDGRMDLYTTGTYTQWGFLHEYPGLPVPLPGRIFRPIAISWMEKMCRGNSLLLQTAKGRFEDATARSGAGRAGWNWSAIAADLDDDGRLDVYATNGMWGDGRVHDRELEFWWETLAYWDDYIAKTKTFDRQGAGVQGVERDAYFVNRAPGPTAFEERGFLDGLDLETNGRAAVAFDANSDGALDVYVRSVQAPEALFLGSRREPDAEHFLRLRLKGTRGKDNADGLGVRVSATLADGRVLVRESGYASGYLSTGSPIVHLGLGRASRVERLVLRWPSGFVQDLGSVATVDRTLVVDEGHGIR